MEKKDKLEVKIENIHFQADPFDMQRFFIEEHGIRVAILIEKGKNLLIQINLNLIDLWALGMDFASIKNTRKKF